MNDVEILLQKIDNIDSIEKLNNFDIEGNLNVSDIYQKKHIIDDILSELRLKRKQISKKKKRALEELEKGSITKEYVEMVCNKYNIISRSVTIFERKGFEIRKKVKSIRLKLAQEEPKKNIKSTITTNNPHKSPLSIKEEIKKHIEKENINGKLIDIIDVMKNRIKRLIEFYINFNNSKYDNKIQELNECLNFLCEITNLNTAYEKNSDIILGSQSRNEMSSKSYLTKEEVECLKCFILKIKQIYIDNIDLIIIKDFKIETINNLITLLDQIIQFNDNKILNISIPSISQEDKVNQFKEILYNNNFNLISEMLDENPELCLSQDKDDYLLKSYLEYLKNEIINHSINDSKIYIYGKIVLLLYKVINQNNYIELKHIYDIFILQFKNLITNLEEKKFDQSRIEQALKFIDIISYEQVTYNEEIDFDKLVEKIYVYHRSMKEKEHIFSYDRIITIDNDDAKLLDTAYNFKKDKKDNYKLTIYIKDVNELLEEVDLENIFKRFTHNKKCFNHDFALKHLSLSSSKNHHKVLSHHFTLDKNFKVIDFKIEKEIIIVRKNLTYTDVMETIFSDKETKLKEMLKLYHLIGNHIIESERKYSLYNKVGIDHLNHNIMLFFNYYMANYCKENNIPTLFLTDEYHSSKLLENQIPYGQYSCPARNFTSFINQLLYGICTYNDISPKNINKLKEILDTYATYLNLESHDSGLKKAKKKAISPK